MKQLKYSFPIIVLITTVISWVMKAWTAHGSTSLPHAPLRELPPIANRPIHVTGRRVLSMRRPDETAILVPKTGRGPQSTTPLKQLQAGDTLYLRAGSYFENVYCAVAGTKEEADHDSSLSGRTSCDRRWDV